MIKTLDEALKEARYEFSKLRHFAEFIPDDCDARLVLRQSFGLGPPDIGLQPGELIGQPVERALHLISRG